MGSSALKNNQKRWSVNELEALTVAYACKQSKIFIPNNPGEIIVNRQHYNLQDVQERLYKNRESEDLKII